jgi:hypothetical protein
MAKYLKRYEGISASHNFVAVLWRGHGLQPHRHGTFKLSRDPDFAVKVADVVGLYLDPPTGAVVLSMDEKTQVQALDRTQPMLPTDSARGSASSRDTPSVEAPFSRFGNSPDTSRTTSPTGTRRLNHSPGPQHPKRSSARSRSWNETSRDS